MKIVQGDLLKLAQDGHFDVIIHGCNCQCTMGAGIAKAIKAAFPAAYAADKQTIKGDRDKMGTISHATVTLDNGHPLTIVNGYTQYHWRGRGVRADYDAIRSVMNAVGQQFAGHRIGYPKIGAGLAGGDWDTIAAIINKALQGQDHTLVEYAP